MGSIDRQLDFDRTDSVLERACAFLQCVGLPPDCAEKRAKAFLTNGESPACDAAHDGVVAALMSQYERWMERLCEREDMGDDGCPALLGTHLRPVLRQHPEFFLEIDNLPPEARTAIRRATLSPVPEETPAVMPTQPLGELPRVFQVNLWNEIAERLRLAKGKALRWLHKARPMP